MDKQEELLKMEREQLKFQKDNLGLFQDLVKGQANIKELVLDMLHHQGKQALIMLLISFLAGIVIGTQYKSWMPYMDDVISTVKSTNAVGSNLK